MNRTSHVVAWAIGVFSILIGSACRHDPITPLSEAPTISFKADVQPIMISNCTQSGCHGSDGHEFKLINYEDIAGKVEAEKPHSSELYKSITSNVFNTMPKPPNPRLTDTQIKTIYLWILQGAKNN